MFSNTESTSNTFEWLGPKDVLIESLVDQLIVTNRRLMKEVDELKAELVAEKAKRFSNTSAEKDGLKINTYTFKVNKTGVENETKKLIREFSPTYRG